MFKKTILTAALLASFPAFSAKFYLVAPIAPGNRTTPAESISVSLNSYQLPTGVVGHAYAGFDFNSVLQVSGDPDYKPSSVKWTLVGGTLPEGLSLSASGQLIGTPIAAASSNFQVMATYKTKTGQMGYQVVVSEVSISLAEAALPAGVQGAAYHYDLKPRLAVSGDPDFSPSNVIWSLAGGALPAGLQLNSDGTITGTPAAEGTHPFTVQASYLGKSGERQYQVVVGAITVSLASATPPAGVAGKVYSGFDLKPQLSVAGDAAYVGNGSGVAWVVSSGILPPGLTLNSTTGEISGTPTTRGAGPVQVTATYKAKTASQSYMFPVSDSVKQYSGYRAWSDGTVAASCLEYRQGKTGYAYDGATGDGVYRIDVDGAGPLTPVDVQCDMTTDGGGWTEIQSRIDGSVNFHRTWADYAQGFGGPRGEHWLGNDRIAALTAPSRELWIDITRYTGDQFVARYSSFKIAGAESNYRLTIGGYSGNAGDSFGPHNEMQFSTLDRDNDNWPGSCSQSFTGGWWFNFCHSSNLNGTYIPGPHESYANSITWLGISGVKTGSDGREGSYEGMIASTMKVR